MKTLSKRDQDIKGRRVQRPVNARVSTPKQRRRQRDILEVRVRSRPAARQRTQRVLVWFSVMLLIGGLAAGGYLAVTKGGAWFFYNNPEYRVSNITVESDGVLSRDAVLDVADIHEGANIFRVNLSLAKSRLEALPQVESVRIQRQLPNSISINLYERKPIAWIAPDSGAKTRAEVCGSKRSFLVDADGVLLQPKKVLPQQIDLPIIRGFSADDLAPGQRADADEVRSALELIRVHQESLIGARFRIMEIDVSRGYGLMVTDRNGTQVLFGLDDPELQLRTLDLLLNSIDASGRKPATISLMTMGDRQRNIPVTFQVDEPAPAAATPAPAAQPSPSAAPKPSAAPNPVEKKKAEPSRDSRSEHHRAEHEHPTAKKPSGEKAPKVEKAIPVIYAEPAAH